MSLEGKCAIVTGGASGIGKACAVALAQVGMKVVIADITPELGEQVVQEINQNGGQARFAEVDVTKADDMDRMLEVASDWNAGRSASVDVLVNSAGVLRYGYVVDLPETDWDLTIDVNLKGTYLCCKAVIPRMIEQGNGAIINIASSGARHYPKEYPAYVAAKTGVLGLTKSLAKELYAHRISVVAVCPDMVDTPMGRQAFREFRQREPQTDDIAVMLTPEDVAKVVLRLADSEMWHATSSIIDIMQG